jgi:hypothetical protein
MSELFDELLGWALIGLMIFSLPAAEVVIALLLAIRDRPK